MDRAEGLGGVDVGRAMQRDHAIAARDALRVEPGLGEQHIGRHGLGQAGAQTVDHDVADEDRALCGDAFARKVVVGGALGGVEHIGNLVGEDAVDLFGHAAVVAAQAGLHVYHRNVTLAGDQRAGERGVYVPHHQYRTRAVRIEDGLEALHDLGGLHRVRPRAHGEVDIGFGQFEIGEQPVLHRRIVMLAGVHQQRADRRVVRGEGADDGRDLHVVGARTNYTDDRRLHGDGGAHRDSSWLGSSRRTAWTS